MLFSEVYGSYYNTLAAIITDAVTGGADSKSISEAVRRHAFGESVLSIPQAIKNMDWPLINADGTTPIKNIPTMPLTALQKRWLKALLQDPRIKLFNPSDEGLEDVEPLFSQDTFIYYDRYNDGDPFDDPEYIQNFRAVLKALREKRKVRVRFNSRTGNRQSWVLVPYSIEYSEKDDKFRLISAGGNHSITVNMARIKSVAVLEECTPEAYHPADCREKSLEFELCDERNALERVMLHYRQEDETELLIRILSFGPVIKVTAPESFVQQIRQRLKMQERFKTE